ncbi:MAG: ubiquinone biosynthesis protein UbiA [Castellaniella sp.]|uniref:UbiA family prenyltransferase n=1 Tax=Castellaniella sp. TaxID=1955812 RepID=UPI0011FC4693|nr:UbiA family prenyltransferase [Castellaniella sp.]TAN28082.1 MAG: ubiquinone biosynthesis protein UbiA [Castellaniella sp.]
MRRFLALSRMTHALLDIAMPGFAALLWLGRFPDWHILLVSLLTVLAGYTAIYALNDLMGLRADREKFAADGINQGYSVEASDLRHPLAQNLLSVRSGMLWFGCWYALMLAGAYWLNPAILLIVLAATVLEVVYCLLLKVTYWRTPVSGLVKSAGPIAAVYAVVPAPAFSGILLMLLWLMLWEIGGQNIPADWNDVAEDKRVGARTIPQTFGPAISGWLVLAALIACVLISLFLPVLSPLELGMPYRFASGAIGILLLLVPASRLWESRESRDAARLFSLASYYPLALLLTVLFFIQW